MSILTAAKAYAEQGVFILAVGPNKAPISGYGLNTATNDPNTVVAIWTKNPSAGIAIACEPSHLVVLDCDPRNGGNETLANLRQADPAFAEALDATVQVETQGGGKHFYFAAEVGASYAGKLGDGLDIKHRGYVVAPPSKGITGSYRWTEGKSLKDLKPISAPRLMARRNESGTQKMETITGTDLPNALAVKDLRFALQLIPADDRDTWINLGMALKTAGEIGHDLWFEWSKRSKKFNQRDADETWASFRPEGTHWKVIFKQANAVADAFVERLHVKGKSVRAAKPERNIFEKDTGSVLDQPIQPFSDEEAKVAELQPRVLVENYLFADLRNLIAAGGVGKTSMLLHEAVCGALGRPIWGNAVPKPFTTVIVTKEDSREILLARMREIMHTLGLSAEDRHTVYKHVFAVDLSGVPYKLAHVVGGQVEPHTENLDTLIEHCKPVAPDRLIFDPLVSFTAGESRVNEAEQGVVEAARYLMRKLPNIAVDIVHHTGKANARMGAMDQYAGRNGSALPDGSRMVAVMTPCSADSFSEGTGYFLDKRAGEKGLRVSFPKMSYAAQPADKYILRRGFHFQCVQSVSAEQRAEIKKTRKSTGKQETMENIKASIVSAVRENSSSTDPLDRFPSRTRVQEFPNVTGKKESRKKALEELIEDEVLVEPEFSAEELGHFATTRVLSGRTTYIALSNEEL